MSGKILTISIAAYNMEEYICQTLDSLIDERVIGELEVFVVDDGGTDRTLDIAKEYAARYPDSIIPVHKENGGYGTTVNYSIAHATGKYFKLLDGDDWFDTEGLAALVDLLKKTDADIVMTPYKRVVEGGDSRIIEESDAIKDQTMRICDLDRVTRRSAKNITAKTEVLRREKSELPSKCLYTDTLYSLKAVAMASTIYYCGACVYCYRLGRDGQSVSRKARAKHYQEGINVAHIASRFYERCNEKKNPNLAIIAQFAAFIYCDSAVKSIMCLDRKTGMKSLKRFEKDSWNISHDIYAAAGRYYGRYSLMLRLLRLTGYMTFPLAKAAFDLRHTL